MSIYKYNMGGNTEIPIEEQVEQMKAQILSALEGGASDKEIMMMVQQSPLKDKYEFNWDNVEMKVEAYPLEGGSDRDKAEAGAAEGAKMGIEALLGKLQSARGAAEDRFGPKDPPGQRGDMFDQGGRTFAGQYMGKVMEDQGGKYGMYEDADGNTTKIYFMEDPGEVGEYVPDNDYVFEEIDGITYARLAGWNKDQRNPKEGQIGKEVMEESTKGASKIENLLEKLQDGRRGMKTYSYGGYTRK